MKLDVTNLINEIKYVDKISSNAREIFENDDFTVYFDIVNRAWYIKNNTNDCKAFVFVRGVDGNGDYAYGHDIAEYLMKIAKKGGILNDNVMVVVLNNGFRRTLGLLFKVNPISILQVPEYDNVATRSPNAYISNVEIKGKDKFTVYYYGYDRTIESPYDVELYEYLVKNLGDIKIGRDIVETKWLNEIMLL